MRSSAVLLLAGIVVAVVISAVPSEAAEWTVDPSPEVGAFSTIWEAILFAAPGDVVRVNPGTYRESLEILTPRQSIIFDMRFNQQMDIREIAACLKCSTINVKTQIFRSLRKLRKTLEPVWGNQ